MSEVEEGAASIVTDTTRNSNEQFTPKILSHLPSLGERSKGDAAMFKTKIASSIGSTDVASPIIPFQKTRKLNLPATQTSDQQDSYSEARSPSLLPQSDRWTESLSIVPNFMKKPKETLESQSQSLLPQNDQWTGRFTHQPDRFTHQPSFLKATCTVQSDSMVPTEPPSHDSVKSNGKYKKLIHKKISNRDLHKSESSVRSSPLPSQSTAVSTDEIDVTVKISERIEKQLAELDKAPRKKMLTIEAGLVHCITSVHGSLDNKLKKLKQSYRRENAEILRKLLQTLKATLVRLIEQHKLEREQFATSTRDSQLTQAETLTQKTQLLELGRRQKQVFSLFTKQRELATKFKEITDNDVYDYSKAESKSKKEKISTSERKTNKNAEDKDKLVIPKTEVQRTVYPRMDEQRIDPPTIDEQRIDQPTIDEQRIDQPTIDEQRIDQPTIDEQRIDQPTIDEQIVLPKSKTDEQSIITSGSGSVKLERIRIGNIEGVPFTQSVKSLSLSQESGYLENRKGSVMDTPSQSERSSLSMFTDEDDLHSDTTTDSDTTIDLEYGYEDIRPKKHRQVKQTKVDSKSEGRITKRVTSPRPTVNDEKEKDDKEIDTNTETSHKLLKSSSLDKMGELDKINETPAEGEKVELEGVAAKERINDPLIKEPEPMDRTYSVKPKECQFNDPLIKEPESIDRTYSVEPKECQLNDPLIKDIESMDRTYSVEPKEGQFNDPLIKDIEYIDKTYSVESKECQFNDRMIREESMDRTRTDSIKHRENDVLSQDVTTIPDTQETSERETEIIDAACTSVSETPSKRTRTKKRPFSPEDDLTPRHKKYTKMQKCVAGDIPRNDSSTETKEGIKQTSESNKTTIKQTAESSQTKFKQALQWKETTTEQSSSANKTPINRASEANRTPIQQPSGASKTPIEQASGKKQTIEQASEACQTTIERASGANQSTIKENSRNQTSIERASRANQRTIKENSRNQTAIEPAQGANQRTTKENSRNQTAIEPAQGANQRTIKENSRNQTAIELASGAYQTTIERASGANQRTIKENQRNQTPTEQALRANQTTIGQASGEKQAAIRQASAANQTTTKQTSKPNQTVIKQVSGASTVEQNSESNKIKHTANRTTIRKDSSANQKTVKQTFGANQTNNKQTPGANQNTNKQTCETNQTNGKQTPGKNQKTNKQTCGTNQTNDKQTPGTNKAAIEQTLCANQAATEINMGKQISSKPIVDISITKNPLFKNDTLLKNQADLGSNFISHLKSSDVEHLSNQASEKLYPSSPKPLAENLWMNMMRKDPNHSAKKDCVTVANKENIDNVNALKSPGDKLNRVIKRITEDKANSLQRNTSSHKEPANFKKPVSDNSTLLSDTGFLKFANEKEVQNSKVRNKADIDVNYGNLYEAGLAVNLLTHPKDKPLSDAPVGTMDRPGRHNSMFSPPRQPAQDDTTISPTATSMSSDVFLVKAKELRKRMKYRQGQTQQHTQQPTDHLNNSLTNTKTLQKSLNEPQSGWNNKIAMLKGKSLNACSFTNPLKNGEPRQFPKTAHHATPAHKTSEEKLEAVINDVIKSAAECSQTEDSSDIQMMHCDTTRITMANPNVSQNINTPSVTMANTGVAQNLNTTRLPMSCIGISQKLDTSRQPMANTYMSQGSRTSNDWMKTVNTNSCLVPNSLTALPTLKNLLLKGHLRAGVNQLSTEYKGQTYKASLAPTGQIRYGGDIFKTPKQWLTHLHGDGIMVKRRWSYQKIFYNGHPLLTYCTDPSMDLIAEQKSTDLGQPHVGTVDREEISTTEENNNWPSSTEGHIYKFLSNCRIRLLQKVDLIPCHDLPDNFWANNFAEVKLPSDIWQCVDDWD